MDCHGGPMGCHSDGLPRGPMDCHDHPPPRHNHTPLPPQPLFHVFDSTKQFRDNIFVLGGEGLVGIDALHLENAIAAKASVLLLGLDGE